MQHHWKSGIPALRIPFSQVLRKQHEGFQTPSGSGYTLAYTTQEFADGYCSAVQNSLQDLLNLVSAASPP